MQPVQVPEQQVEVQPVLASGPGKRLEYRLNLWSDKAKKLYGSKAFKVGLSLGEKCPNRAKRGCIFCIPSTFTEDNNNYSIQQQLDIGIAKIRKGVGRELVYLAYFQDETTGAIKINKLRDAFEIASSDSRVKGIIASTRPDYCDDEYLQLCKKYNVHIELGMQTIHDKSLELLGRNHTFQDTKLALERIKHHGLHAGVHLIIGIPDESLEDMIETIHYANRQDIITDVKLHNLVAFKGSKLYDCDLDLINIDEYIELLMKLIPEISVEKTISRFFTSNLHRNQIARNVSGEKKVWLNKLLSELYAHGMYQGMNVRGYFE